MARFATAQASGKAQVQALFDSLALEYVRGRERNFSFVAQKRLVMEMLDGVRGRILEVGCGPAVMTPELVAIGLQVHGIDISGEMVRRARERMAGHPLETHCCFALGDFERLQFPDGSFDAVLAMGVLEYLPDYAPALRSAARVLKPGGVAVLTVPNRVSSYHLGRAAYVALRHTARTLRGRPPATEPQPHLCLPWLLDRELARAGLQKEDSAACNFVFFPLKELQPRLSDWLNRALDPMARRSFARLLGAQYVVKARRRA
jgi:ubiquinone/menaquinone biosynthesis C-methylase UbiE